jgi:hypothetical protein
MFNTIPDQYRKLAIESIFNTKTFQNCWQTWQPEINRLLGNNYGENEIINLGDHLSDIFKSTGVGGRGQGELSAGGNCLGIFGLLVYKSLLCWK